MKLATLFLIALLTFSGCAHQLRWDAPNGQTQEQWNADINGCGAESLKVPRNVTRSGQIVTWDRQDYVLKCMYAKGYKIVEVSQ